jgi:hypothetical protein
VIFSGFLHQDITKILLSGFKHHKHKPKPNSFIRFSRRHDMTYLLYGDMHIYSMVTNYYVYFYFPIKKAREFGTHKQL